VEHLHHTYNPEKDGIQALKDVSLSIQPGEYVVIVGHNGSGKSTLAKHLNAILLPTSGDVWVKDMNTKASKHRLDIRSTVGMVFQNPDNQLVATIVEEDVAFGPENLGVPVEELRSRVDEALELVDMTPYRHRAPHLLSMGQKQRIAIAGILAMRPEVLVLDEATAMLDPRGRRGVLDTLRRLRQRGVTIVAITHFMHEAVEADRVIVLEKGRIALEGPPRDVFREAAQLQALQLDVPQVTELAHRLHKRNGKIPPDVLTVDEMVQAVEKAVAGRTLECQETPAAVPGPSNPPTTPQSGTPIIHVENLSHTYLQGTPLATEALRRVDMDVYPGEIVGIMGHTGCGKSTLIQHFNGLLRPHRGTVIVDGADMSDPKTDVRAIRRKVGLVFQAPELQLFERYAGDDVAFGPRNLGLSWDETRERVRWAMESVGLGFEEFKDRFTFALSGGERRKVAVAGVLAMRPKIMVFDEPTSGLDPRGRRDMLDTIRRLNREQGMTVVLVSHNMEDLAEMCDRIYVISDGETIAHGTPKELFANPEPLLEQGLGVPQVTEVVHTLRAHGLPVAADVLTVEEAERELDYLLDGEGSHE
jgi:energy-coupling factor transport system ATP-binding protein